MSPNHVEFVGFGARDVTKACEFISFGAMDVTKPYKFLRIADIYGPNPYESLSRLTFRHQKTDVRFIVLAPHTPLRGSWGAATAQRRVTRETDSKANSRQLSVHPPKMKSNIQP